MENKKVNPRDLAELLVLVIPVALTVVLVFWEILK